MTVPALASPSPRSRTFYKAITLLAIALVLLAAHRLGLLEVFSDPDRAARAVAGLGAWGYLAFVAAYTVLQPIGVPGTVFIVAAPLIWPWPVAFALSMIGTMAASVVGFSLARFVGRERVAKMIPERFRRYDDALAARGFTTVFVLRFVFWMPQVLHTFLGVSKVPFWTHFWGSLAGYLVPLLLVSYFGRRLFDAAMDAPASFWIALAAGCLLLIVTTKLLGPRIRRHLTACSTSR